MHFKPDELIPALQQAHPSLTDVQAWVCLACINSNSTNQWVVLNELRRYIKFYAPPYSYGALASKFLQTEIAQVTHLIQSTPMLNALFGERRAALIAAATARATEELLLTRGKTRLRGISDEMLKLASNADDPGDKLAALKAAADVEFKAINVKEEQKMVQQEVKRTIINAILSQDL